ncbi:MAG: YfhO family protein [Ruminococcus sp.]|nr:YfhO family protein [Ruminococcus sp.]
MSIFKKSDHKDLRSKTGILTNYWLLYTLLFLFTFAVTYCYFLFSHKSMVWSSDAKNQHLTSLMYLGIWIRDLFKNIFVNHSFSIPTYSFGLGYGGDIIQILHYYVVGDPLDLFSIFVPSGKTHLLYHFLIVLRLYLAGIAFSKLCFYFNRERSKAAVLAGAVAYVFGGFALFAGSRHPYFINPMIYFPIIVVGVDKIIKKRSPIIYIIGVFLSAISNFYFFYMIVIFTVLYVAVKLFVLRKELKLRDFLFCLLKFGGYAVFAVVMAGVILLPVLLQVLGDPRGSAGVKTEFLYSAVYYKQYLSSFMTLGMTNDLWLYLGFTGVAIPSLVTLFSQRKKRTLLKISFIVLTLFTLTPIAGKLFNGMTYPSNRWVWVYALLVAYIITDTAEDLLNLSKRQSLYCIAVIMVYLGLCFLTKTSFVSNTIVQLMIAMFVVLAVMAVQPSNSKRGLPQKSRGLILLIAAVVGVAFSAYSGISPQNTTYLTKYDKIYNQMTRLQANEAAALNKKYDDGEFYRYTGNVLNKNASLINNNSSTQFFFSLSNPNIFEFFEDLDVNVTMGQIYYGLDERTSLNTLANVKYYVSTKVATDANGNVKDKEAKYVPYGYSKMPDIWVFKKNGKLLSGKKAEELSDKKSFGKFAVYTNENSLPFGYTYSYYLLRGDFEKFNPVEKQEAMLQSVMLDKDAPSVKQGNPELTGKEINYQIKADDKKATVLDDRIVTVKENARVTLTFDGMKSAETYLYLEGINFKGTNRIDLYNNDKSIDPQDVFTPSGWNKMPGSQQSKVRAKASNYEEPGKLFIRIKGNGAEKQTAKKIRFHTPSYKYYEGKHDFLVNLNYSEKAKKSITIIFPSRGIYTFKDIKVYCQPMDKYANQVKALKQDTLTKVDFHKLDNSGATNEITGEISLKENKILLLTIPYSKGWKAYVDGKESEILRANTMFSALELSKGSHTIRLTYATPGFKIGIVLSALGALAFIGFIVLTIVKRRKNS